MNAKMSSTMRESLFSKIICNTFTIARMYQNHKMGANSILCQVIFVKETQIKSANVQMGHSLMVIFVKVAQILKSIILQQAFVKTFVTLIQIPLVIQKNLLLLIQIVGMEKLILKRFVTFKWHILAHVQKIVCLIVLTL